MGKIRNGHANAAQTSQKATGRSERKGGHLRPAAPLRQNQNLPLQAAPIIASETDSQPAAKIAVQRYSRIFIMRDYGT